MKSCPKFSSDGVTNAIWTDGTMHTSLSLCVNFADIMS